LVMYANAKADQMVFPNATANKYNQARASVILEILDKWDQQQQQEERRARDWKRDFKWYYLMSISLIVLTLIAGPHWWPDFDILPFVAHLIFLLVGFILFKHERFILHGGCYLLYLIAVILTLIRFR